MNIVELKKIAAEIKDKLPYQKTKDSPTIKYYTDWPRYEKHLSKKPRGEAELKPWIHEHVERDEKYALVIVKPQESIIRPGNTRAEISVLNIDTADNDIVSLVDPHEGRVLATHIALLEKALLIRVPEEEEARVRIVMVPPLEGHMPFHIKAVAEEGSNLELELFVAEGGNAGLITLTLEEHVSSHARLSSLALLDINSSSTFYGIRRALVQEKGQNRMNTIITGGFMAHFKDESIQKGRGAEATISASIMAYKNERVDYITNTINDATDTSAIIGVKGFNLGGFLVNRGTIKATENGYDSINKLESILIPLSSEGYTVSVPMLEVDTDIVKEGSHSADISGLVEDQLFYLKSRGLTLEEAISLAIQSTILGVLQYSDNVDYEFAEKLALEISNEFLRKRL